MIKYFFATILVASTFMAGTATAAPTEEKVSQFIESMIPIFSAMKGVNGFAAGSCDSKTGEESDSTNSSESCVVIYTKTRDAEKNLKAVFPPRARASGILIAIIFVGIVEFH